MTLSSVVLTAAGAGAVPVLIFVAVRSFLRDGPKFISSMTAIFGSEKYAGRARKVLGLLEGGGQARGSSGRETRPGECEPDANAPRRLRWPMNRLSKRKAKRGADGQRGVLTPGISADRLGLAA